VAADEDTIAHAEAWVLIPWLVNGTLADDEAARVRSHCARCEACRREVAEQTRLAAAVAAQDLADDVLEDAWAAMRVRLEGPDRVGAGQRRQGPDRSRRFRPRAWWAVPVAVAAALVLLVATPSPPPAPFVTVTDPRPRLAHDVLRVQVLPGVGEAALRPLLEAHRLTVIDGPDPSGVYTLSIADPDSLAGAAAALAASPAVAAVVSRAADR
jgi:hypothetical protein